MQRLPPNQCQDALIVNHEQHWLKERVFADRRTPLRPLLYQGQD